MSQHLTALAKGNELRVQAARLRQEVRALGAEDAAARAADILCFDESEAAGSLWIDELLRCVPRIGPGRADRMVRAVGVRGRRRLRELTPRQRGALGDQLLAARRTA